MIGSIERELRFVMKFYLFFLLASWSKMVASLSLFRPLLTSPFQRPSGRLPRPTPLLSSKTKIFQSAEGSSEKHVDHQAYTSPFGQQVLVTKQKVDFELDKIIYFVNRMFLQ